MAEEFYATGAKNKERRVDIVLGPPGSGKSSRMVEPLQEQHGSMVVDSDLIKPRLPEYKGGRFAGAVHQESSDIADRIVNRGMDNGDNLVLPLVGKNTKRIANIVKELKDEGYTTHLHLMEISPEEGARRSIKRFEETGRFVDPKRALEVGLNPRKTFDTLKSEVESYEAFSNEVPRGQAPRLLETSTPGRSSGGRNLESTDKAAAGAGEKAEGIPPDQVVPPTIPPRAGSLPEAQAVEKMYNNADGELSALGKSNLKKIRQAVARATLDVSAEVKKRLLADGGEDGRQAVIRHDLMRGSSAKSELIYTEKAKDIYDDLAKAEEKVLDRIIQSRRTIVVERINPDIKSSGGLGEQPHKAYLQALEIADPARFKKLNARADIYFKAMQSQLADLHKHGLVSNEAFKAITDNGDYSPRRFIQHMDPDRTFDFGGRKVSVADSGIKRLAEGSIQSMENKSRLLLQDVVARTQKRIARNEANKALIDLAEQNPENGIVRVLKKGEDPQKGIEERIQGVRNGETVDLAMPNELARQWVESDPAIDSNLANIVGWLSGAKILRPMATGLNPEFALTNMPRDIAHVWLTTHEYSPHLPVAIPQMAKDFATVAKDAVTRRGSYVDYINEGGGMSFLTHQGRVTSRTKGWATDLQKALGYLGETSEVWTRLALRNRALANGKPPHEATWVARNYLDFAQGGWAIKAVDSGIPYLNASVQATRGSLGRLTRNQASLPGRWLRWVFWPRGSTLPTGSSIPKLGRPYPTGRRSTTSSSLPLCHSLTSRETSGSCTSRWPRINRNACSVLSLKDSRQRLPGIPLMVTR